MHTIMKSDYKHLLAWLRSLIKKNLDIKVHLSADEVGSWGSIYILSDPASNSYGLIINIVAVVALTFEVSTFAVRRS